MISVPFIYFCILLIVILKSKKRFEISAYITVLYCITSFFSILIDVFNLRSFDTEKYNIGFIPTVLYCFLITISILPFYYFQSDKIKFITIHNIKFFKLIAHLYIFCFFLILFISFESIIQVLKGDFSELRLLAYRGELDFTTRYRNGLLISLTTFANIIGGFSFLALLHYFYSITFLQNSRIFNNLLLLSSFSIVIIGIIGIDRSKSFYWIISYFLLLVLFWPHLNYNKRKKIKLTSSILIGTVLLYFFAVTESRFGERDMGTEGGIISYAGQSFINFCFFFDTIEHKQTSLERIFPLYYKFFEPNSFNSSRDLNAYISLVTGGKSISVFSTFIGDILVASGKNVAISYCIVFCFLSFIFCRRRNVKVVSFEHYLIIFCLATIPMLGLFIHFYATYIRVIPFWLFIISSLLIIINRNK